ncbi:MAG: lipopolysaccharide biosynthesis, partial [Boseongicola sp.]|nr:lipopolysaccharide biosynthesis [Boseongicola sp.]
KRLPLMATIFVLCSAIGIGLALMLPSKYIADATLLVESPQIPDELAASTVRTSPTERLQIIEQRLMTRANLIDIANEFEVFGGRGRMTPDEVVEEMRDLTEIRRTASRGGATFMTISFRATSPNLSAGVANEFVTLVLNDDSERRQSLAEQTLDFFEESVDRLNQQLALQSAEIVEFKDANQDALPENLDFRIDRLSRLQDQLIAAARDRAALTEQRSRMMVIGQGATGVQLSPAQQELAATQEELRRALTVYSETNPRVRMLRARVAQLSETAANEDQTAVATAVDPNAALFDLEMEAIERRVVFLDEQETRITSEVEELRDAIERTPENAIRLESLEREYQNTLNQYNTAVQNLARAQTGERIEVLSKGERISVIEQATPPTEPNSPNRPLIAGGGVALGMALALGIFFLLELTNRAIRRPADLVKGLSIQPIATIPYLETTGGKARRRALQSILIAALAIGIPAVLWAVHTFYLPIDLIVDRVISRFGF